MININCQSSTNNLYCKNKKVKRSLFGIGARVCSIVDGKNCPYQEEYPMPVAPPGGTGEFSEQNEVHIYVHHVKE